MYAAVRVSLPGARDPAGMLNIALPLESVVPTEVYPPPDNTTDPVGVGFPLPPLSETVTVIGWAVVMLDDEGVTVTTGVVFETVTVTADVVTGL